jgi:hypothetical protein
MIDPTKAQSKAEASRRLAEIAKTERARELFKQLAEDYEKRARGELTSELIEQAEAAPPLAAVTPLVAEVAPLVVEAPVVPEAPAVPEVAAAIDVPLVPEAPVVAETAAAGEIALAEQVSLVPEAPAAPQVPVTESEHFLAVLKAFREDAARGG